MQRASLGHLLPTCDRELPGTAGVDEACAVSRAHELGTAFAREVDVVRFFIEVNASRRSRILGDVLRLRTHGLLRGLDSPGFSSPLDTSTNIPRHSVSEFASAVRGLLSFAGEE